MHPFIAMLTHWLGSPWTAGAGLLVTLTLIVAFGWRMYVAEDLERVTNSWLWHGVMVVAVVIGAVSLDVILLSS